MRLTIWGAGAIGGTLGAWLVKSGQDVLFVDKVADHVKEIPPSARARLGGHWKNVAGA